MDFAEKIKNKEPYFKTEPKTAAEKADKARRLCYEIKSSLKRAGDGLRLYPAEWDGVSAEAHNQFCTELVGEMNENSDALDALIEKLNAVIRMYSANETKSGTDTGLPSSIL